MHELLNDKELNDLLIRPFSWMLIHSLWQGALWSVLLAAALQLARKGSAVLRYNLTLVVFFLFLFSCAVTFFYERQSFNGLKVASVNVNQVYPAAQHQQNFIVQILGYGSACVSRYAPFITLLWFLVFAYRSARLLQGIAYLKQAKHKFTQSAETYWQERVAILCDQLKLQVPVRLLTSGLVKTPMVIGHLKPLILIPAALMAGLPPGQIEAILLHELAHIRRRDYLVNLLQTVAEAFFCFNPGLLWISALLREERENCCDDVMLAHTNSRQELADALISCKEYEIYGNRYSVTFPGRKNLLLHRIKRILGHPIPANTGLSTYSIAIVLSLFVMLATVTVAKVKVAAMPVLKAVKTAIPVRKVAVKPPVKVLAFKISALKNKTAAIRWRTVPIKPVKALTNEIARPILPIGPVPPIDTLSDQQRAANDRARAVHDRSLALQNRSQPVAVPIRPKITD